MNNVLSRKPPGSFWAISIALLIWNAMGVIAYIWQVTANSEQLAQSYPAAEIAILSSAPGWVSGAFAVAVFAGISGAFGLLARKGWSRPVFVLSLLAVLIQHAWTFFFSGLLDIVGPERLIMPIIVLIVCVFQIWYAGNGINRGWLR